LAVCTLQVKAACGGDESRVFIKGEGGKADKEMLKHSRDMSSHKRAQPDVVVYPKTAGDLLQSDVV
jgi:hypothetical protein